MSRINTGALDQRSRAQLQLYPQSATPFLALSGPINKTNAV